MTTTTRNEAADLLMEQIEAQLEEAIPGYQRRPMALRDRVREAMGSTLDAALAAAKAEGAREAVERIRAWATEQTALADREQRVAPLYEILRILDEEAAR